MISKIFNNSVARVPSGQNQCWLVQKHFSVITTMYWLISSKENKKMEGEENIISHIWISRVRHVPFIPERVYSFSCLSSKFKRFC